MAEIKVAVLGAGTMGAGIAELCVTRGCAVSLFDVLDEQRERASRALFERLDKRVQKGTLTSDALASIRERFSLHHALAEAVHDATFVIEAVPENMDLKVRVFSEAKAHAKSTAVLASNTSSLSITELGQRLSCAERVIGMHFFNPPPVMPLIEIVRGLATSDETLAHTNALVDTLGKERIVVNDQPGFATSRLGVLLGAEAMRMLETRVANIVDIDRAMELGYRHPMGPLKLTDLVGLDVRLAILEHLEREIGPQFRPPTLLRQMVRAGLLGKKSGRGFYLWNDDGPVPNTELLR